MKNMILASGSPRRCELLKQIGFEFEVIPSGCTEDIPPAAPADTAAALSRLKCSDVADSICNGSIIPKASSDEGYIVIGADTIVVLDGQILGKPSDRTEAFSMLKMLKGHTHTVYTGVTIIDTSGADYLTFTEHTDVTMYDLSDDEIWQYIDTGEPMDKAGAYGIQGRGAVLVKEIRGDYFTVVGLPVARLARELGNFMK